MTGSVYVTEVHEALPRCHRRADVIATSLLFFCSASVLQDRAVPPKGGVLQRAGSHGLQLLEGIVKAALEVRVGDDQDAFLVPRHQADLLRNSRVQLEEQTKAFKTQENSRY